MIPSRHLFCSTRPIDVASVVLVLLLGVLGPAGNALAINAYVPGEVVAMLFPGASIEAVNQRWNTTTLDAYPEADLYLLAVPSGWTELEFAEEISADPDVDEAEPNYYQETPEGIREMVLSATGGSYVDYIDQSAVERIGLEEAHTITRGTGIIVAVLDTGIDMTHPVFAGMISPDAYDFIDDDADPGETANGLDDDDDGLTDEGYGHGTVVAGIIALVAPDAILMPLRVLDDEGRGEAFAVAKALRYAELHGAEVLNLSFGSPLEVNALEMQFEAIEGSEMTIVSGAGNEDLSAPAYYPGRHDKILMVTALDSLDIKAEFADHYAEVFVAAPGDGIFSPYPESGWAIGSGCSFAVPFIAGEAALMLSIAPDLDPHAMETIITMAVDEIYSIPENQPYIGTLGAGRLRVPIAVNEALSEVVAVAEQPVPVVGAGLRLRSLPNPATGGVLWRLPAGLTGAAPIQVDIFDAAGRIIRSTSFRGDSFRWDGRGAGDLPVPSGQYFIRMHGPDAPVATGRVTLIR